MNNLLILLGWIGVFGPVGFGALGSTLGVAIAGQAAIGAMLESDGGYGRYVGVSVIPSSNVIYGIVVMFSLRLHAGRIARGVHLHRRRYLRILPPDGPPRAYDRRQHFALGAGHARDFGAIGGDSR